MIQRTFIRSLCALAVFAGSSRVLSTPPDMPRNIPYALFIPEFPGLGSWQQVPTVDAPTVPVNWAKMSDFEMPVNNDDPYFGEVITPYEMVDWAAVTAMGVPPHGNGNALFSPGDGGSLFVGVRGPVVSSGMWFGSGDTTLYQIDAAATIHPPNSYGLSLTLVRMMLRGSDGSLPVIPVNVEPNVEIGVPLEGSGLGGLPNEISLEGGRLTLSANNTFTNLSIRSFRGRTGTVVINTPAPFGGAAVALLSGINFEVKDTSAATPSRVLNNHFFAPQLYTPEISPSTPMISNRAVLNVAGSGNLTFNGNLTTGYTVGPTAGLGMGFSMSGSGIATLNGSNDFGVSVTVNSGTLALGNNAALNGNGPLVLNGGAIQSSGVARTVSPPAVKVSGNFAVTGLLDLTVNGPVDLDGATRTATISAPTVTITGPMTNGGLTKSGAGTLVLTGINTHEGGTNVNQGVLQLNTGGVSGTIRGTVGVSGAGTLRLNAANSLGFGLGTKVNIINIVGGLLDNVANGDNGWGISINLNGATMQSNGGTNSPATPQRYSLGGGSSISSFANGAASVVAGRIELREGNPSDRLPVNVADGAAVDDLIIRASITESGGIYGLTKTGPGTLLLVAGADNLIGSSSSYTGSTVVNAGVLAVDGNQTANRLSANHSVIVNSGGTFEIRGVNALPILDTAIDVTVNQGGIFRAVSGGSAFLGASTASHAHVRNITLNGGTIDLTYSGTLAAFDGESFEMNGTLTVAGSAPSLIQSTATVARQGIALAGLRTFQVGDVTGSPAADLTVNAQLESTGLTPEDDGLRKTGPGTLLLARPNTYLGQTIVEEGTVQLTGSLSGATIVDGGIFTGGGSAKAITVNAGGTLAPGNGLGFFSSESVIFAGGAFAIEINTSTQAADWHSITGNITLGSTPVPLLLSDLGADAPLPGGTTFNFLSYTGTWDGNPFFWNGDPLPDDAMFTVGANVFRMDYGTVASKSFAIVAVPEPATPALLILSTALLSAARRRKRVSEPVADSN